MTDAFNWHFPQRNQTMFMATIQSSTNNRLTQRQSSFLRQDIPGAQNKLQIPVNVNKNNFSNSAFIEPKPQSHIMKNKYIETNNLRVRDIEGAYPQCSQFKTNRVVNPLAPKYKLPYVPPVDIQPPRKFLRNTLDISDVVRKRVYKSIDGDYKGPVQGGSPAKLFRPVQQVSRLDVRDINQDGIFKSGRLSNPTDPLEPTYTWRQDRSHVNSLYGTIDSKPKSLFPQKTRLKDSMNIYDIQGAKANSSNQKRYFFNVRRQYRDVLNTADIPKTNASSLKKGIVTNRSVNPLVPQYRYPQP